MPNHRQLSAGSPETLFDVVFQLLAQLGVKGNRFVAIDSKRLRT
jgi:hypothetical protein